MPIESVSDAVLLKWVETYDLHPDKLYLEEIGYTAFEVQSEYMRRFQYIKE